MTAFTPQNNIAVEQTQDGLCFRVTSSDAGHFHNERSSVCRNYLQTEGVYRLPLRIDMTVTLDAPRFYVMLGRGRVSFASAGSNRCIEDIAAPHYKPFMYADHLPLHTPVDISIIYNLHSMQILVDGEQRYYSAKEKYMKSAAFPDMNAAGLSLRLSAHKRTTVRLHRFNVTESASEIEINQMESVPVPCWTKPEKPTFESIIGELPENIQAKVTDTDHFLQTFKPFKFKRTIDKNGGKITYLASEAGVSYMVLVHHDVMRHTFGSYLLWNSKDNLGEHNAKPLNDAFNKLSAEDSDFVSRMLSYKADCTGCSPNCICRVTYAVQGTAYAACHGKIEFQMVPSEFDDVMRLVQVMGTM